MCSFRRLPQVPSEVLNEWKELNIRRRKLVVGQFLWLHPSEFITTQGRRGTVQPVALKEVEGDGLALIVVIDLKKAFDGLHPHAQFFPDLSFKTGFHALSGLLLAARELPVPGKMASLGPPRNEKLSVFPD
jgi:hypothetical protein